MTTPTGGIISCSRYVSLVTYRRDGSEVATPVWIAACEEKFYVFSESRAGKVKRLRNNSQVRLAKCDMRGEVLTDWREAHGTLVDDEHTIDKAYRALRQKYGWQMRLADFFSKLTGRYDQRSMLEIKLHG